jgi:hypothetical protein
MPSPDASTLILNFSASRTIRNRSLLFINYPVSGILLQQQETDQDIMGCGSSAALSQAVVLR